MRAPWHPYLVLVLALLLPGAGHVAVGHAQRGLGFAFFALLLAALCWFTTTPDQSFIGRAAGGFFVWALSIPDAYSIARLNYERWRRASLGGSPC
jgi:Na+/proline symporter